MNSWTLGILLAKTKTSLMSSSIFITSLKLMKLTQR